MKIHEKYLVSELGPGPVPGDRADAALKADKKKLYQDYTNFHKLAKNELQRIETLLHNHRLEFIGGGVLDLSKDDPWVKGVRTRTLPSKKGFDLKKAQGEVKGIEKLVKNLHRIIIWK